MSNQLTRFNRVRYRIYGNAIGVVSISEPGGWLEDEKELIRSDKYFGITANLSNSSLQFYGRAFIALKSEYDINGIKAVVRIEREERNENTDIWELNYSAYFDFSTYKQNKNYIQIKLNESEFFKNIESRFKDTFELERLTDSKGGVLQPLVYKDLTLQGRDIFRESKFNMLLDYYIYSDKTVGFAFFMDLVYKSDVSVYQPAISTLSSGQIVEETAFCISRPGSLNIRFQTNQLFYIKAENVTTYKIKIKFDYSVQQTSSLDETIWRTKGFIIDKCFDNGDISENWRSNQRFILEQFDLQNHNVLNGSVDNEITVTLQINESLVFSFGSTQLYDGGKIKCQLSNFSMIMETITTGSVTKVKALTYYQVFERLFQIITGKNTFSSDLLLDKWKDLLFTNGFKIRQFPQSENKNISTSLEEVYNSLNSIDDIGLFIKNNTIKVEQKQLAFQTIIGLDLGEVSNIERNIEEKLHYSTVEIGNDFDGVYEEVNGLDEYNIRTSYVTCLDSLDNKFSAISKVRFDAYGMTLAQDKLYVNNPKLDTKYDKNNFAIDCKIENGVYVVRHWQDDFATQPTGIFSPNTAFNLRLSPFNSVLRKAKTISIGLQKYPNELFQYSSTEGNSQLVTLYPERAIVQNNVLPVPYILPETISFEKEISMAQFKQIVDYPYNLIKFVNELGLDEYGFIYPSVKPNKEGKFILIKANI